MLNSYIFVIRKQNATRNCNVLFKFLYFGFLAPPNPHVIAWLLIRCRLGSSMAGAANAYVQQRVLQVSLAPVHANAWHKQKIV